MATMLVAACVLCPCALEHSEQSRFADNLLHTAGCLSMCKAKEPSLAMDQSIYFLPAFSALHADRCAMKATAATQIQHGER